MVVFLAGGRLIETEGEIVIGTGIVETGEAAQAGVWDHLLPVELPAEEGTELRRNKKSTLFLFFFLSVRVVSNWKCKFLLPRSPPRRSPARYRRRSPSPRRRRSVDRDRRRRSSDRGSRRRSPDRWRRSSERERNSKYDRSSSRDRSGRRDKDRKSRSKERRSSVDRKDDKDKDKSSKKDKKIEVEEKNSKKSATVVESMAKKDLRNGRSRSSSSHSSDSSSSDDEAQIEAR